MILREIIITIIPSEVHCNIFSLLPLTVIRIIFSGHYCLKCYIIFLNVDQIITNYNFIKRMKDIRTACIIKLSQIFQN